MRLTISKAQHRAIIQAVAHQLGSEKAIDGLEHILNCWLVGNVPPSPTASPSIGSSPAIEAPKASDTEDEFANLVEF